MDVSTDHQPSDSAHLSGPLQEELYRHFQWCAEYLTREGSFRTVTIVEQGAYAVAFSSHPEDGYYPWLPPMAYERPNMSVFGPRDFLTQRPSDGERDPNVGLGQPGVDFVSLDHRLASTAETNPASSVLGGFPAVEDIDSTLLDLGRGSPAGKTPTHPPSPPSPDRASLPGARLRQPQSHLRGQHPRISHAQSASHAPGESHGDRVRRSSRANGRRGASSGASATPTTPGPHGQSIFDVLDDEPVRLSHRNVRR